MWEGHQPQRRIPSLKWAVASESLKVAQSVAAQPENCTNCIDKLSRQLEIPILVSIILIT